MSKLLLIFFTYVFSSGFAQSIAMDSVLQHLNSVNSSFSKADYYRLDIAHYNDGVLINQESLSHYNIDATKSYTQLGEEEQLLFGDYVFIRLKNSLELIIKYKDKQINQEAFDFGLQMSAFFETYKGAKPISATLEHGDLTNKIVIDMAESNPSVSEFSFVFNKNHSPQESMFRYHKSFALMNEVSASKITYHYIEGRSNIEKSLKEFTASLNLNKGFLELSGLYRGYEILNATNLIIKIDE